MVRKINKEDHEYINSLSSAILEKSPFKFRIILYIWTFTIAMFLVWANFTQIDEIVRGDGEIVPSGENQIVQNLEGGIVKDILVKEGDRVKKGDILLTIDNQKSESSLKSSKIEADDLKIQILRLQAQSKLDKLKINKQIKKEFPLLVKREEKLFLTKMKHLNSQIDIIKEQKLQRKGEFKEVQRLEKDLYRGLLLINEEVAITKPMVDKKIKPKVEFLKLQREQNSIQERYNSVKISIPRIKSSLKEIDKKIIELKNLFMSQSQEQLNKTVSLYQRLITQSDAFEDQVKRTVLKSPVNGTIQKMFIHTKGGVVKSGDDLIEIVPSDATLWVEAKIKPADIAFIYPKQKTTVKVSAYDFAIYGGLDGRVIGISPDTIVDKDKNTFYKIFIKTKQKVNSNTKQNINLIPGMTVNVDIITGKKTVMDYILKPILKTKQYMFTDR